MVNDYNLNGRVIQRGETALAATANAYPAVPQLRLNISNQSTVRLAIYSTTDSLDWKINGLISSTIEQELMAEEEVAALANSSQTFYNSGFEFIEVYVKSHNAGSPTGFQIYYETKTDRI